MKSFLSIFVLLLCVNISCQSHLSSFINEDQLIKKKFTADINKDKIGDLVLIVDQKNTSEDNVTKRRLIILLGVKKSNNYHKVFDSFEILPCIECSGKSDANADDLSFKNNTLTFTISTYPLGGNSYSISTYNLTYVNNNFTIARYSEKFYKNASEETPVELSLSRNDLKTVNFNYYDFDFANNSWIDHLVINNKNVTKINNIANSYYDNDQFERSISIYKKILTICPDRAVTNLNLGDSYWSLNEKKMAAEEYKKYLALIKLQKKDTSKIPPYVFERIK